MTHFYIRIQENCNRIKKLLPIIADRKEIIVNRKKSNLSISKYSHSRKREINPNYTGKKDNNFSHKDSLNLEDNHTLDQKLKCCKKKTTEN